MTEARLRNEGNLEVKASRVVTHAGHCACFFPKLRVVHSQPACTDLAQALLLFWTKFSAMHRLCMRADRRALFLVTRR